ncbi:YebC/PmpR family DNA-binding transcriptional regulator [bacterium]|nr:MAG: YebC/PmpR family DNA-binding transcriptional regulator [bacterium]
MSGHSHWSGIKHKKELTDAKRGKIFTKAARLITVSAKQGGLDPDMNPTLRLAIEKAKGVNMPKANIERAIQKASSKDSGANIEEVSYEAFGPGGVAMIIQGITDNKNRAVGDVRRTITKHNGRMTEQGSVAWMFSTKSRMQVLNNVDSLKLSDDDLELAIIESGADDIKKEDNEILIYTEPNLAHAVQSSLETHGIQTSLPEIELIPKQTVTLNKHDQEKLDKILEELDDCDDVVEIFTNS